MRIFVRLKGYLVNKMVLLLNGLEHDRIANNVQKIRRQQNVSIDYSLVCGSESEIVIEGRCRKLLIEKSVDIRKFCTIRLGNDASLLLRANVFLNNNCSINCMQSIEIGENVLFGEGVKIYDHNHRHSYKESSLEVQRNDLSTAPVIIGKNCWIGSNAIILKGVTIGENVIIGANCLIHKSIPPNSIVKQHSELIIEQRDGQQISK